MICRLVAPLVAAIALLALPAACYETNLGYVAGIMELTSSCYSRGIELGTTPVSGIAWPKAHERSYYGLVPLGNGVHPVMIDLRDGEYDLYVDAKLSGEFQVVEWDWEVGESSRLASISFQIQYSEEETASYQLFLIWDHANPGVLTYCRDSYRVGEIQLGGQVYRLAVLDEDSDGAYDDLDSGTLVIDADGNGDLLLTSDSHEVFSLAEPFNLSGSVYVVDAMAPDGSWIEIVPSRADVELKQPLLVTYPAPLFEAIGSDGSDFSLKALRGNIVVLDFWAGWCGFCIAELPTLRQIESEFEAKGVIVIGINMDRSERDFHSAVEGHGISHLQIHDSAAGPIGELYRIQGIPMNYIIDRNGIIRARGLRGDDLIVAIRELIQNED